MKTTIHKFGVRIDGVLHTLFGTLNDDEFQAATTFGLPKNWVAWHIEECELSEMPSGRVLEIRKLPMIGLRWQDAMKDALADRPLGTTGYAVSTL